VLFGRIRGAKTHAAGDLGTRGRITGRFRQLSNELQNFRLPVSERIHLSSYWFPIQH